MFKLLKKKILNEEPLINKEIPLHELQLWVNNEMSKHQFKNFLKKYFAKIKQLKSETFEKNKILETQEVPEKHKNVEVRIQSTVKGHRDHYVRELFQFLEKLECTSEKKIPESVLFNNNLYEMMNELAKKTSKSYEATQYLFYKQVEPIFKSICKLNALVKKFSQKVKKLKINKMLEIQDLLIKLHEADQKRKVFKSLTDELHKKKEMLETSIKTKKSKLLKLQKSKTLQDLPDLKEKDLHFKKELEELDQQIHSYFSKLQKPLRKYGHITQDNKILHLYIENSLTAFKNDLVLDILDILNDLKDNIMRLGFDKKQETHFLQLIKNANSPFFKRWHEKEKVILQKRRILNESINKINVPNEVKIINQEIQKLKKNATIIDEESKKLLSKSHKIDIELIKNEITTRIKEAFSIDLKIIIS